MVKWLIISELPPPYTTLREYYTDANIGKFYRIHLIYMGILQKKSQPPRRLRLWLGNNKSYLTISKGDFSSPVKRARWIVAERPALLFWLSAR